jgi:hypothetical protein
MQRTNDAVSDGVVNPHKLFQPFGSGEGGWGCGGCRQAGKLLEPSDEGL